MRISIEFYTNQSFNMSKNLILQVRLQFINCYFQPGTTYLECQDLDITNMHELSVNCDTSKIEKVH